MVKKGKIMQLQKALKIANVLIKKLRPHCEIINLAGSCRREKPEVHDIEICVLPKFDSIPDLFGTQTAKTYSEGFIKTVQDLGKIIKGSAYDGRYCQIELQEGINLDLFIPQSKDYYRQFVIRTGSADYSHKIIARAWRELGWVGTEDGLRRVEDCYSIELKDGKILHRAKTKNPILPPVWQSEREFFDWLKIAWKEPKERE